MVTGDGVLQPKCVKSIDEGFTLLTKGEYDILALCDVVGYLSETCQCMK